MIIIIMCYWNKGESAFMLTAIIVTTLITMEMLAMTLSVIAEKFQHSAFININELLR